MNAADSAIEEPILVILQLLELLFNFLDVGFESPLG
jgi:hypothetical protein